jgi:single-stranded-DNA-specific exonuclease
MAVSRLAREWRLRRCDEGKARELAEAASLHPVVARVLVLRGIETPEAAQAFLDSSLHGLHDGWLLPDMRIAAERLCRAVKDKEPILIYGDYDVDGLSGTALLTDFLSRLDANVSTYIPHRMDEGYGLNVPAVEEAAAAGIKLLVTVDCGTRAVDAVARGNRMGVEFIITDHHEPGETLPPAVALVNPKRHDSAYPSRDLAGVGVAFKLAEAVVDLMGLPKTSFYRGYLDLVALGTVADVVPVTGENRVLTRHGLECLRHTRKTGLRSLIRASGYEGKPLTPISVGFGLGPRLNASGRMDSAERALRLLMSSDRAEADALAEQLNDANRERRAEEARILEQALAMVDEAVDLAEERVLVLSAPAWHPGVVGIVASRVKECYARPAFILCEEEENGVARGSCRSIEGFDIAAALDAVKHLLTQHGGHAMAAGVTLPLPLLDRFRDEINAYAARTMDPELLVPIAWLDQELQPDEVDLDLCNAVGQLAPFGTGNAEPVFGCRNVKIEHIRRIGDGSHLRLRVSGQTSRLVECVAFGMGDLAESLKLGNRVDISFTVEANEWQGTVSPQLRIREIRPART